MKSVLLVTQPRRVKPLPAHARREFSSRLLFVFDELGGILLVRGYRR